MGPLGDAVCQIVVGFSGCLHGCHIFADFAGSPQIICFLKQELHASTPLSLDAKPLLAFCFFLGLAPGIMRGRLAIPIHSREGMLLAYCGRTVKNESPTLIFPNGFRPADVIYNGDRVQPGELYLVRDPLQVLMAYESGIENVVSFLTEAISAQQLEQLAALMDEKQCDSVVLF